MQVVDQQQRGDAAGPRRATAAIRSPVLAGGEQRVDDPLEARRRTSARPPRRAPRRARGWPSSPPASSRVLQLLDTFERAASARPRPDGRACPSRHASAVGVCITLRTLPPPVYMCTPHGRHGSNERTARMMSIALEVLRSVLLEDRRVLHGVLVGPGSPVDVARARVPRGRRVGLVVRDLALADHHVMREHAARGLVEAAADRALRDLEACSSSWSGRPGPPSSPARGCAARSARCTPGGRCGRGRARSRWTSPARSTRAPSRACSASAAAPSGSSGRSPSA